MSSEKCRNHSQRGRIKSSPKTPNTLRGFDEFVEEFEKELNEWEVLEKKYPHIPTRMRRVRNRFNRLAKEYRGKFETACCNSNFIEESDVCSKCKEHSE